jgi:hypothetical protein
LQLEQDGLGSLPCEPQLAALGVVAEAFRRYRWDLDLEKPVDRHDRELAHEVLSRLAGEHGEAPEP